MSEETTQGQVAYDASVAIVLAGQAQRALTNAADFTVDSDEMLTMAGDDLKAVKALQKQVEEKRTGITGPLNQAVKAINDLFRAPADFLKQAETTLKGAMLTYTEDQERKAVEARRAAEDLARQERERLAEQERQQQAAAQEAEAAALLARQEAEAAAAAGDTAAAQEAEQRAAAQEQAAHAAQAEAMATAHTAEVISMPPAVQSAPKVRGVSTSTSVDYEVTNLQDLVQHIAAHPELLSLVAADSVKLRAYVRGLGMNTRLPGVRVFEKKTMSARAAA